MDLLAKDIILSFCPAAVRRDQDFGSTVRVKQAAAVTGFFGILIFGALQVVRYRHFLVVRLGQFAPVIAGSSEAVQSAGFFVITLEFLMQPLSLLLTYFFLEGWVRAISAALFDEPLPSLPVFLGFTAFSGLKQKKKRRQVANLPPDTIDVLDGERLCIASCQSKSGWNATVTISIRGEWYELDHEEQGRAPHAYVYILKRASMGRVLRGFQAYDPDSAVQLNKEHAGAGIDDGHGE